MAVYTQVSAEALGDFLTRFDVGELVSFKGIAEGVENSNYLVETTRDRFILTLYEKRVAAADLPFFMALLDHLAERGQPVPPAIADREGREIHELCGRPACLIRFLPGVSLSEPTAEQARAAGTAMGKMHAALTDFDLARENTMGVEHWQPLFDKCGKSLNEISQGLYDDLGFQLDEVLSAWPAETQMPRSVIHADLFPDNVLMLGDDVTGLIDFYFACTDFRAYDIAVMHSAWSFDNEGRRFDREIGNALLDGYQKIVPFEAAERAALVDLARGACIRFLLSRAWDWLNTPADAMVTRKDPMAYWRRLETYDAMDGLFA
ncbi:homoserine kinase [Stakelama marina]|uniref:Homoserine kinase n=1 Tax=Stakelama marina TaxID=2826939 RepID=A0A8T4IBG3_9SPHN|nr:homoserine kinase [Stakelama marina]MBR0552358.1 homoserine kinase [Stakelama marina]